MNKERQPYDPSQSLARRAMDKCDHLSFEIDEIRKLMIMLGHESRKQCRLLVAGTLWLALTCLIFAGILIFSFFN